MRKISAVLAVLTILFLISACGPSEQDAQKQGFANVEEMKEIQAKGFKTKEEYEISEAKRLGWDSVAEMKALQAKGFNSAKDYQEYLVKAREEAALKEQEEKNKQYLDNKKRIDWIANNIGGYKGSAVCQVTLDMIETVMINKGMLGNKDGYESARKQYEIVDIKYLMEGVSQSDIDAAYSSALKKYADGKNPATVDCYAILEKAPK